jgi:hypothetical protein
MGVKMRSIIVGPNLTGDELCRYSLLQFSFSSLANGLRMSLRYGATKTPSPTTPMVFQTDLQSPALSIGRLYALVRCAPFQAHGSRFIGATSLCAINYCSTFGTQRFLSPAVNKMKQCQERMPIQHPRTCISHHGSNPLSRGFSVAMSRTVGTSCLSLLKWTLAETFLGIQQQFITLWAKRNSGFVVCVAVYADHCLDGSVYPAHARVVARYGWHSRLFYLFGAHLT